MRKEIREKGEIFRIYDNGFINQLVSSLRFKGFPTEIDTRFIMLEMLHGKTGFLKDKNGKYHVLHGEYTGAQINDYGLGERFIMNSYGANGSYEGVVGEDVEVLHLNKLMNSEYEYIDRIAEQYAEVEISQDALIECTRNMDVVVARTSKLRQMLTDILQKRRKGKHAVVCSDSAITDINGLPPFTMIPLSNPAQISNMQNLIDYSNELDKRRLMRYGICLNFNGKRAQQNDNEISRDMAVAMITPLEWFNNINEWLERVNTKWGLNCSVEFSEVLQCEYKKYKAFLEANDNNGDGIITDEEITGEDERGLQKDEETN